MKPIIWILIGIAAGAGALYLYEKNKPSELEQAVNEAAGEAEREAEKSQGRISKFIDDTAEKFDNAMNKELN